MRVCFPVNHEKGLEGPVYGHFGSASKFLVVDTETDSCFVTENMNANHIHGSCNPAIALANQKIDAVVVGGIGGGALSRLNSLGIKVYQSERGNISSNLAKFKSGELKEMSVSSCSSHDHDHEQNHPHRHEHLGHGKRIGGGPHFNKN
ncbi:MAG: diguanylate cyclase [Calditerrivibrio sp.]|nr:diguanylate cyclase [Calditerrivibrio sp.]